MVSEELVFGSSTRFKVLAVQQLDDQVVLSVQSCSKGCPCPGCNIFSSKLHSYYFRKVKDLPAFDNKVSVHLKAKKWYCLNTQCPRKIFTDRFHQFFRPYKRTTNRLRKKLLKVALLIGGRPGEKLCRTLNISVSSSSLIRIIYQQPVSNPCFVDAVGIDDSRIQKRH